MRRRSPQRRLRRHRRRRRTRRWSPQRRLRRHWRSVQHALCQEHFDRFSLLGGSV